MIILLCNSTANRDSTYVHKQRFFTCYRQKSNYDNLLLYVHFLKFKMVTLTGSYCSNILHKYLKLRGYDFDSFFLSSGSVPADCRRFRHRNLRMCALRCS